MQRSERERLLRRLLAAIGAGSASFTLGAGCSDSQVSEPSLDAAGPAMQADGPEAGATLDSGPPAPVAPRDAGPEASSSLPGEVTVNDAGVQTTRVVPTQACPPRPEVVRGFGGEPLLSANCSAEARAQYYGEQVCLPAPAVGAGCAEAYDVSCVANVYEGGLISTATFVCGPFASSAGECCYVLTGDLAVGRPFTVGGQARVAPCAEGPGWTAAVAPDVSGMDGETRLALADAYARDGLAEHASVASFSRFALQCLACGAPAELVRGAQRAALDEVAHAELSFGLARAYGGRELRPGALAVLGALDGALDARSVAESVAREGAIAETVSALIVAGARDAAREPAVRAVLARVADEEAEHALLAWKYLRWALDTGDDTLRAALREVFAKAAEHVGFGTTTALPGDAQVMRDHGYLPIAERRRIATDALEGVVTVAARALLAGERSDPRRPEHARLGGRPTAGP